MASSRSLRAFMVSSTEPPSAKVFLEDELEGENLDSVSARANKVERLLGLSSQLSAQQQLAWLDHRSPSVKSERAVKTKALQVLGATVQDLRVEKALLVLGEAPGREIPGGKLTRVKSETERISVSLVSEDGQCKDANVFAKDIVSSTVCRLLGIAACGRICFGNEPLFAPHEHSFSDYGIEDGGRLVSDSLSVY